MAPSRCARGGAGVSTYIRELLFELPRHIEGRIAALVAADAVGELPPEVAALPMPVASGVRRTLQGLRSPRVQSRLLHGLDVDLPLRSAAATVTTVHDLAVFDTPWAFSAHRVLGERLVVAHALRHADAVIAVSAFTAERIQALSGREATVIPEAPSRTMRVATASEIAAARRQYALPERYVLHVGTVEPR